MNLKSFLAVAVVSLAAVGNAHAGGFLADVFIRPFSPSAADQADKLHERLGKPLDVAAAAFLSRLASRAPV